MVNFHMSSCIDRSGDGDSHGFAQAWLFAFSFIRLQKDYFCTRELRWSTRVGQTRSVWSIWCVFVYLVDLVHLVSFVQPKNQTNQIDQMNKAGWRTFSASCYSGTRISIQGGDSSTMSENRLAVLLAGIPGKTAPRRI